MRNSTRTHGRQLLVPALVVVLLLSACGSADADATPTMGVDAIFTAAFQTLEAQQATQLALTPPTNTPSPSPFPTLPPPSPASTLAPLTGTTPLGGSTVCDNSAYVADVTIPDGTTIKAGEKFTKTWKIYNSGSCAWTTAYKIAFVSGEAMGGATTLIPVAVPAGQQADISVVLTAPNTNGTFRGDWRMQNAGGVGFGNVVYVEIKVGSGSSASVTPGPSPTPGGPTATTSGGTTFTISGATGVGSGTTVKCVGDGPKPTSDAVMTNGGNNYTCTVPLHWRGYIEPFKNGWTFTPEQSPLFDDVLANHTFDFTASQ